ncbi:DNA-processing protein DprA [Desertibacillus haloalkaliphilus]|uniref:DNA-processing protein DprA n=1 Tax=Desertibacillus haloalkaliphilus TaxID=1328930 RepID=UPI001C27546A|nr:DNA-processing protein DprA [Desertibacillus haloalkaliphilus]MBU8907024.1 DNA-processing protein DprA [Desertibacillus haloalkaliphilus]
MEGAKERLIHIHSCRGVGWKTIQRFVRFDSTLQSIYSMGIAELMKTFKMKTENAQYFYEDLHSYSIQFMLSLYERKNIIPITIVDESYPTLLKQIYDPPWVLYSMGDLQLLEHQLTIAVVGTRQPSSNGLHSMKKILTPLIGQGWTIISGLAIGIDTYAHKLALVGQGRTIAVLGSGFFHIYPKQNQSLAAHLSREHLLLSEYPPHQKPQRWQFPVRNRIISGLSLGTLIVEAKEKSGSLITADQALEQGREVFAMPGSVLEERSMGTNRLIQQGAKLVMTDTDIVNELIPEK